MKEGTFVGPNQGWDFEEDIQISKTKMNTAETEVFDTSTLPENVQRSRAVEALIQQNDDLMSRLSVSLRKIAELEEVLQKGEADKEEYKVRYENLRDQVLVLKEKTKILSDRRNAEDTSVQELKEQIQMLEIRYSELYQSSQSTEAHLQNELSYAQLTLRRYQKFSSHLQKIAHQFREENSNNGGKLKQLQKRSADQEVLLEQVRKTASESAGYIQEQAKKHQKEVLDLTRTYEQQITHINTQNSSLRERQQEFEELLELKAQLENEIVIAQRRFDDYRLESQTEITDLKKDLARHRASNKEFSLELNHLRTENDETNEKNRELQHKLDASTEQVESLQCLWKDNQKQIEKLSEKNVSLQKLNQDLSISINRYRQEIRDLKAKADQKAAEDKSNTIKKQAVEKITETPKTEPADNALFEKIDKALGNLQVGK